MPRNEQTVAYSISPALPTTTGRLAKFSTTGHPSYASDSVFREEDSANRIIIGTNAAVNAGQAANGRIILIGEDSSAWGDDVICIGRGAIAGQTAAKDGAIVIGASTAANAKNAIRIGTGLGFGAAAGDNSISIGCQTNAGVALNGIAIGRGAIVSQDGIAIGHTASTNGTTNGIAIGKNAVAAATGVNHFSIAIGESAAAGANNTQSAIAIGRSASALHALGVSLMAIGDDATANVSSGQQSIALGAGATVTASNEIVIGDSLNGNHIAIFTVKSVAGAGVKHRSGADGSWSVVDVANANTHLKVDASAVADDIRLLVWDVTAAVLKRVSRGGNGVAPVAGFRCLQIPV